MANARLLIKIFTEPWVHPLIFPHASFIFLPKFDKTFDLL